VPEGSRPQSPSATVMERKQAKSDKRETSITCTFVGVRGEADLVQTGEKQEIIKEEKRKGIQIK